MSRDDPLKEFYSKRGGIRAKIRCGIKRGLICFLKMIETTAGLYVGENGPAEKETIMQGTEGIVRGMV